MTVNLKTRETVDAVISRITSAIGSTITFAPKIVQEGDFSFYTEKRDLLDDLPSVFVIASKLDLEPAYITAEDWALAFSIRILVVDSWDDLDSLQPREKQQSHAEEIAQVFIGGVGYGYDVGGVIGLDPLLVFPTQIDFEPPESKVLSFDQERQLFAVAVTIQVQGQSARV